MGVGETIFLSAYGIVSITNLVFCLLENEKLRKISKPFCMLTLLGFVLFSNPSHSYLWISLILALVGDVLFIFKKKKIYVLLGIFFFLAAHVFYLIEFGFIFKNIDSSLFSSYSTFLYFYPLSLLPALPISYFLSKKDWKLTLAGSLYQSVLIGVFASAVFGLVNTNGNCLGFILILIGAVFYYTSDFFNAFTMFIKKLKKREFYIMSTYLLAQLAIVLGFYFLIGAAL